MPGQAARNLSASSRVSTRGGARRTRSGVGPLRMKPRACAAATTAADSGTARVSPIRRPAPRTSVTRGSAARPSRRCAPRTAACSSRPSFSMVSMTARPAAQATGLPPKVVPWLPGSKRCPAGAEADDGADGDAAAEALRDRDEVGRGLRAVGEPLAGASQAGLDLVEPQQRTGLGGDGARGRQIAGGRDDDAGLALDRLEHHGGRLVGDGGAERVDVGVRDEGDLARERLERRAVGLLGRQREGAHRATVEGTFRGDQVGAAGAPRSA